MTDRPSYELETDRVPTLGLIVLRVDETIEHDFRRLIPRDRARLHVTRIRSGDTLTPDSIAAMGAGLTDAAALLPPAATFDAVGYACTSGTALLGAGTVATQVQAGAQTRHVTNPLSAALAAFEARGLRRIGIVSPYVASVAEPLKQAFEGGGVSVPATLSFGEAEEAKVARIAPRSIADAARSLARGADLDGIFLSCTNLRTLDIVGPLSAELGMPVLSSNQVLAWHMAQLADLGDLGLIAD